MSVQGISYPGDNNGQALGEVVPKARIVTPVAAPGTPVQFTATAKTWASWAVVVPRKTGNVANTGNVFIGPSAAVNTQNIVLATGATPYNLPIPVGGKIDLSLWYVDAATNADGIVIYYGV